MGKWGEFDISEFIQLRDRLQAMLDDNIIEQFIRDFLTEMAHRAIRKIKKRTPVDTGLLRNSWSIGTIVKQGNAYVIEVYSDIEYAHFVEYGFHAHWVPGRWEGNTFVYDASAKTGMQVGRKGGWVPGKFMLTISMKEMERELPRYLEKRQKRLLQQLLNGGGDKS
ncbi:MAG: HK97 gp10 family phage protein [Paenibacillus dendritiformis]|uniref:HK97 gp10 family phage protein n=1 Tax=uncultured Paenibacillus sp. TaxID=227322 RepID=UPI0025ECD045|nr:HK97 gp10 family phage protein [uncultured Paenibacillus sp.]MDU5141067.1 HK97 gp10 family phage protein [Paenibacillus dendritiformis]